MTSLEGDGIATVGAVRFLGARRSDWHLLVRGAVLLMVTLGIYCFWLMTDVRRFLWTNTEVSGENLEYAPRWNCCSAFWSRSHFRSRSTPASSSPRSTSARSAECRD